jgi:outer membrane protein
MLRLVRSFQRNLWLAGLLALGSLPLAGAVAATLPEAKFAVVDYQKVLKQSEAGQDVHRQFEDYRKSFQALVKHDEDTLRAVEEKLKQDRASLAPAEFEKRRRTFEERVIALQRRAQDSMRALDNGFQESMNDLHKKVLPLVKELSEKQGYNIVVDRSKVVIALKAVDLTDEVIDAVNKQIPKFKVPKPTVK